MDQLTATAASGIRARMESLDMLANNIANTSTTGFKLDREFYSLYVGSDATASPTGNIETSPVIERNWTDHAQGALQTTGKPFDLALEGRGFFSVQSSSGTLYTRAGAFHLSPDGTVRTAEGYALRLEGGAPLKSNGTQNIDIGPDGSVHQGGQTLGKLEVVDFKSPDALSKQGAAYFTKTDATANPIPSGAQVRQGALEGSNVGAAESAVRLVSVLRQFEMLQKAMSIGADMSRSAIEQVARVS